MRPRQKPERRAGRQLSLFPVYTSSSHPISLPHPQTATQIFLQFPSGLVLLHLLWRTSNTSCTCFRKGEKATRCFPASSRKFSYLRMAVGRGPGKQERGGGATEGQRRKERQREGGRMREREREREGGGGVVCWLLNVPSTC